MGDALGAPYEGLWSNSIPPENELITGFAEFEGYPYGQYTDDTQLTIATVESISGIYLGVDAIPNHLVHSVCQSQYLRNLAKQYCILVTSH